MTLWTGLADTDGTEAPQHRAGRGGQETNVADGFDGTESTEEFALGSTFPTSCTNDLWLVGELFLFSKLFHLVGPAKGLSVILQLKLAGVFFCKIGRYIFFYPNFGVFIILPCTEIKKEEEMETQLT